MPYFRLLYFTDKKVDFYNAVTSSNDRSRVATARLVDMKYVKRDYGQDQHIVFVADLSCPNISDYFDMVLYITYFRNNAHNCFRNVI